MKVSPSLNYQQKQGGKKDNSLKSLQNLWCNYIKVTSSRGVVLALFPCSYLVHGILTAY